MSAVLPAEVGAWVRQVAEGGMTQQQNLIYGSGATVLVEHWQLNPDGTMQLELCDWNGRRLWRGIFRPAEGA